MEYIIPLLIGAAVPLITMLINRKFDLLNLGKSHDLSLAKEYFVRKLTAFEKGTAYYSIAHLSITNISIIFKSITKDNVDLSGETVQTMLSQIQKNVDDVFKLTQDGALALPLYTNVGPTDDDEVFFEKYIELLGEINLAGNVIKLINEEIDSESNPQEIKKLENIEEGQIQAMGGKIDELYQLSKTVKTRYKNITNSLRGQLRQYDN